MQFDVISFLIGLLTLPAAAAVLWLVAKVIAAFTLRSIAPNGCNVCDHLGKWELGDRTNAAFHFADWRHDLLWARRRWHRDAWRAHRWNRRSTWEDGTVGHRVECNQPGCEFLSVRGPYSNLRVAVIVGRMHERAKHAGALTTYVEEQS